jgi:hypothetical protein
MFLYTSIVIQRIDNWAYIYNNDLFFPRKINKIRLVNIENK